MSKFTLFLLSCFFILGCATTKEEANLDQRIKAEQQANTPEEIALRAAEVFASAPGLTMEQKTKLHALYLKTYADSREIRKEIGQMKSLLFKEAALKKFDSPDITELTRRIIAADQRRLNIMFAAFQEMQKIVGYGADKKEIYEHLRDYDYPGNAGR